MNTGTIVDAAAADDPARIAVIVDGRSIDYGELQAAVRQCAAGLVAHGVTAGHRVAVVDTGSLLSIAIVLGAARIGAAAALMNPALTSPELQGLVKNAGCADVAAARPQRRATPIRRGGRRERAGDVNGLSPSDCDHCR